MVVEVVAAALPDAELPLGAVVPDTDPDPVADAPELPEEAI